MQNSFESFLMIRTHAMVLTLCGALCMSFAGLAIRSIESADGFQILFYRSSTLALMVMAIACIRRKQGPIAFYLSIDWWDMVMGVLMAVAFSFYVYAILNTNVASALFILSSAPIFAAILGWIFAGERPSLITTIAIGLAIVGVGLMVYDGFESGGLLGMVFAMISALCFAGMLVLIRWLKREDALGGTFVGGVLAMLLNEGIALTIGTGIIVSGWDLGLSLFMGAFTIGIGMAFVTWAAGYLPASEVSILVLFESVVAPIWVWLAYNEAATINVIIGGAIVLGAVTLQASASGRGRKRV